MILINNEILLENTMDLNEFINHLDGEVYNDESEKVSECIISFLFDVWNRDEQLTRMIQKKISDTLFPVIFVDIDETADLKRLEFTAISSDKDWEPKKADSIAFNNFCEKYFKTLKPLYNRFCELDV